MCFQNTSWDAAQATLVTIQPPIRTRFFVAKNRAKVEEVNSLASVWIVKAEHIALAMRAGVENTWVFS